jgi:hypothetical protein
MEKAPAFREQAVKEAGARSREDAMMTANYKRLPTYDTYLKHFALTVNLVKLPVLMRKSNR